jgi:DNA replication protein DnaC
MERTDILELMSALKLYGIRATYDEVMATGLKRRHEPPRIVGDLLSAEIAEKKARSIKYQLTIAKLPLAKDSDDFDFTGTPINEALVRDLASGGLLAEQRNAVLIGGTGTGTSHLAIAIARACIRGGARGRFYTVVDFVNRLESEARSGRQGRLADHRTRLDFVVLDDQSAIRVVPVRICGCPPSGPVGRLEVEQCEAPDDLCLLLCLLGRDLLPQKAVALSGDLRLDLRDLGSLAAY